MSLRAFFGAARSSLRHAITNRLSVHFVVGNESADLDSIVCSILYSYISSSASPHNRKYIPVVNVPRSDLDIRPELLALLPYAGLEPANLFTIDEIDSLSPLQPEQTFWTLVDHNAPTGIVKDKYSARVVGCIDHHNDSNFTLLELEDAELQPWVIQTAGSCTSLVIEQCREAWDRLVRSDSSQSGIGPDQNHNVSNIEAAYLALGPVLIDTQNLRSEDKTTDIDVKAFKYLEEKLRIGLQTTNEAPFDRTAFYNKLSNAKTDTSQLKVPDVLRKDYKEWQISGPDVTLGISTVPMSLTQLVQKAASELEELSSGDGEESNEQDNHTAMLSGLEKLCNKFVIPFVKGNHLSLYSIMFAYSRSEGEEAEALKFGAREAGRDEMKGGFERQLLMTASNEKFKRIIKSLEEQMSESLQLKELAYSKDDNYIAWQQEATNHSRKQVAPIILDTLRNISNDSS